MLVIIATQSYDFNLNNTNKIFNSRLIKFDSFMIYY